MIQKFVVYVNHVGEEPILPGQIGEAVKYGIDGPEVASIHTEEVVLTPKEGDADATDN